MDLRDRKYVNNTGQLPGYNDGLESPKVDTEKLSGWSKLKSRWNNGGGVAATNALGTTLGAVQ